MKLAVFLALRDIGLKQCDHLSYIFYVYIQLTYHFSHIHSSPRHLFRANYLWPTFRVLRCNGQNQTILATVDLQLLYVF